VEYNTPKEGNDGYDKSRAASELAEHFFLYEARADGEKSGCRNGSKSINESHIYLKNKYISRVKNKKIAYANIIQQILDFVNIKLVPNLVFFVLFERKNRAFDQSTAGRYLCKR
jgi:hypothetical protein